MSGTHRDIVLVSMDSLWADHRSHLGDDRNLTPTMDALADDGVMFKDAIAPGPQTFSSMPAVFPGHHHEQVYEENIHVPYIAHNAGVSRDISAPTSFRSIQDVTMQIARNGTFDPTATTGTIRLLIERKRPASDRQRLQIQVQRTRRPVLFDLERDPDEQTDSSERYPDLRREFQERLCRLERHTTETGQLHCATKKTSLLGGV